MRRGPLLLALLVLLSACATEPRYRPSASRLARATPPRASLARSHHIDRPPPARALAVVDLPGWADEDHLAALVAFQRGCGLDPEPDFASACAAGRALKSPDELTAKRFFETRFRAELVGEDGVLTGYFAPEYEARAEPDEIFSAAVRPPPPELMRGPDGRFAPWLTRAEIEATPGPALAFMRPEDLFFLQIQGSGYLSFPDGRRLRAVYAADNGQPFVGIAAPLAARGSLAPARTSGEAIRAWLADHRGPEAEAITDQDPRYVFFTLDEDTASEPTGSAGVPLTPGRSGAVDPAYHGWGEALWVDASAPSLRAAAARYQRLVMALDSGGAIRGPVRVDLYLGRGQAAGVEAGRIKHRLTLWRLAPTTAVD